MESNPDIGQTETANEFRSVGLRNTLFENHWTAQVGTRAVRSRPPIAGGDVKWRSGFGRPSEVIITTGLSDSSPRNVSTELEKAHVCTRTCMYMHVHSRSLHNNQRGT